MTRCKFLNTFLSLLFMVVVPMMACSVSLSGCVHRNTGRTRVIDTDTGEPSDKGQNQEEKRDYILGFIPIPWTYWVNELSDIEKITGDIKEPILWINTISLILALVLGAVAVSVQTPPINTWTRRGAIVAALVYIGSVVLLFAFGLIVEFWWIFLIIVILSLAYIFKDKGLDIGRIFKPKNKE